MVQRGMVAVRSARTALLVALLAGFWLTSVGVTSVSAPAGASTPLLTAGAKQDAGGPHSTASPSEAPDSELVLLSAFHFVASQPAASTSAAQKPFPIGYVIGGILVVIGIGGSIYGQRMRIRARKPPRT